MKFCTKTLTTLCFAFLLTSCGGERVVKSADAAKVAEGLSFSNTNIVSGVEKSKLTNSTIEGGLNSYAQKELNTFSSEEKTNEINNPSDYMVSSKTIKLMGDKNTIYKVNGTAITIEDTYIQTTLITPINYVKDIETYYYASNGMLEKLVLESTHGFVDGSYYTATWENIYSWVVSK